ncbi:MAG TPA: hypothetical protein VNJ53_06990 [Gaiellaceae bacterium]|nr:hypothetical protein [Gaiellaceae bacterium]
MARGGTARRQLPPPLPPEERTVGQLVAEAIRMYGTRPLVAVLIGAVVVAVNVLAIAVPRDVALALSPVALGLALTPAYLLAIGAVTGASLRSRDALRAFLVGVLVMLPFPYLVFTLVLPGLAWLALVGLSVPAALVERLPAWDALKRGVALARADYVHALGGLCALAIVVFVTQASVYLALRAYAESAAQVAAALAALVASPLLFFGGALLYVDQEARLRAKRARG